MAQLQQASQELQKTRADVKGLPELLAELEGLKKGHHMIHRLHRGSSHPSSLSHDLPLSIFNTHSHPHTRLTPSFSLYLCRSPTPTHSQLSPSPSHHIKQNTQTLIGLSL
ncbi:hypothetical protein COLO4_32165 [Corchorus olitorius]|uniref:Uncharacterized protein n=1 Tax=Corchorus olitorius TaxID=93759 RepID=A0A1R3H0U1_9ROSI|nr:hypothetical protein COLO4_32165 [Corchorus olitorius]